MTASTEIDFEIHPSATRVPDAERERILEAPGFGQVLHRPHDHAALERRARLA